jgi:hypothetical protein
MRSMRTLKAIACLVLASMALTAMPSLGASPNTSIVLYRPGKAFLGTISGLSFTPTGSFRTSGWSDIAVGADTMLLYDKRDGRLRTGLFVNGVFTPRANRQIPEGFTHVAASCDTALFYRRRSGRAMTAPIVNGRVQLSQKDTFFMGRGFRLVEASCDTAILLKRSDGTGSVTVKNGLLQGGMYTDQSDSLVVPTPTRLAATTNSYLMVDVPDADGVWGLATGGAIDPPNGSATDFAVVWDIIAGAPTTIYFYDRPTRAGCVSSLSGGAYTFLGCLPSAPARIKLIAAGR